QLNIMLTGTELQIYVVIAESAARISGRRKLVKVVARQFAITSTGTKYPSTVKIVISGKKSRARVVESRSDIRFIGIIPPICVQNARKNGKEDERNVRREIAISPNVPEAAAANRTDQMKLQTTRLVKLA